MRHGSKIERRSFFKIGAAGLGAAAFAGRFERLARASVPLQPTFDRATGLPLLLLPPGFQYTSMSWFKDAMSGGVKVPTNHDGGGLFVNPKTGNFHYVRNCEGQSGPALLSGGAAGVPVYDPSAATATSRNGGGTTTVVFNPKTFTYVETFASLAGTRRNCGGGVTPWRTWFTCEENLEHPNSPTRVKDHGFVFQVDPFGVGDPRPITAMGRFNHEAATPDPATGYVYLTEDAATSGFYRFRPAALATKKPAALVAEDMYAGGTLEMLKIVGSPGRDTSNDDSNAGPVRYKVEWVTIDSPSFQGAGDALHVYKQGAAKGGATFRKGEGLWEFGRRFYFCVTNGGPIPAGYAVGWGQVWEYSPATEELRLVFTSRGPAEVVSPDNITVRPGTGGMLLCEDNAQVLSNGSAFDWDVSRIQGLSPKGTIFDFCASNVNLTQAVPSHPEYPIGDHRSAEWAGAAFCPSGRWLFVNVYHPGITFAITGPWHTLGL